MTLSDVALKAGVSRAAVSRTFTAGASVSAKMRARVEAAAQELGYSPNLLARSLTTRKTQLVGLNSRAQEWQTVLDLVFRDWGHALFGYGWGVRFENPAVGGLPVLFTHSLLSALLLKTGVFGAGLVFTTLVFVVLKALPVLAQRRALFLILVFPLLISGGIYASYKSLGFGLILLVFFEKAHLKLEKKSPVVA